MTNIQNNSKFFDIAESVSFPAEEDKILLYWDEIDAFQTSLRQSQGKPHFTFYDGPPFATGLPHYGHFLPMSMKDVLTRYAHQTGRHVPRRFGWDCHGLPIEHIINKELGIEHPDQVSSRGIAGIAEYNAACRAGVMKYAEEWRRTVRRMGRWIDMDNDYRTMHTSFMESVWWVWAQLWEKRLIYRGVKVMPYSTACATPLSNFEAGQNYKDVDDPSVVAVFPLLPPSQEENTEKKKSDKKKDVKKAGKITEEECLLAWTTTPWTLPSNMALCVNPNLRYVRVRCKLNSNSSQSSKASKQLDISAFQGRVFILAEQRLAGVLPGGEKWTDNFEIVQSSDSTKSENNDSSFPGSDLIGRRYRPLFEYSAKSPGGCISCGGATSAVFKVVADNYVSASSGTGIVHQAPYFGEDDFRVAMREGVIRADATPAELAAWCPVDASGRFCGEWLPDWLRGVHVKAADKPLIKEMRASGRLFSHSSHRHPYPMCWRSDTPLIYKAHPTWFIRVEPHRDRLRHTTMTQTRWVPDFVRTNRFQNWLAEAKDWAVSRNRFWGTPIPLWTNEDFSEVVCVASIAELEQRTGRPAGSIRDLHREFVDDLEIPSRFEGRPPLRRVPEVFDCWFESGSMPYAQVGLSTTAGTGSGSVSGAGGGGWSSMDNPSSCAGRMSRDQFLDPNHGHFPAQFIAEGIDQTRGWFYTLTVLGTLLFGRAPFNNVICNGVVVGEDGKKLSKRLKNYPDPGHIMEKIGSDALRIYLLNSPAVRGQDLCFRESTLSQVTNNVLRPWYNTVRILINTALRNWSAVNGGAFYQLDYDCVPEPRAEMDRWIMSYANSLMIDVHKEFKEYQLDRITPRFINFFKLLTNCYVRTQRKRLRGDELMDANKNSKNNNNKRDCATNEAALSDWKSCIDTLFWVTLRMTVLLAPFAPFASEFFYQKLRPFVTWQPDSQLLAALNGIGLSAVRDDVSTTSSTASPQSVHYLMLPRGQSQRILPELEHRLKCANLVIDTGIKLREQHNVSLKTPLRNAIVLVLQSKQRDDATTTTTTTTQTVSPAGVAQTTEVERKRDHLESMAEIIRQELNIRQLRVSVDAAHYGIGWRAELNHKTLGKRLRGDHPRVMQLAKQLTNEQLERYRNAPPEERSIVIGGHTLTGDDMEVVMDTSALDTKNAGGDDATGGNNATVAMPANWTNGADEEGLGFVVLLDIAVDNDQRLELARRETLNRIQKLRKQLHLSPEDPIQISWSLSRSKAGAATTKKKGEEAAGGAAVVTCELEDLRHVLTDLAHLRQINKVIAQPLSEDTKLTSLQNDKTNNGNVASCDRLPDNRVAVCPIFDVSLHLLIRHDHARLPPSAQCCSASSSTVASSATSLASSLAAAVRPRLERPVQPWLNAALFDQTKEGAAAATMTQSTPRDTTTLLLSSATRCVSDVSHLKRLVRSAFGLDGVQHPDDRVALYWSGADQSNALKEVDEAALQQIVREEKLHGCWLYVVLIR